MLVVMFFILVKGEEKQQLMEEAKKKAITSVLTQRTNTKELKPEYRKDRSSHILET